MVLVKIEDKKKRKILKELLEDRYKVVLYTGDTKEVMLNEDDWFEEDVDDIISTSSIQNKQSIKENILSIFVQIYIDTISSEVMKFETRPICVSKQTKPRNVFPEQSDTYTFKSRYYDSNIKSFKYMDKPIKPYVSTSQILRFVLC